MSKHVAHIPASEMKSNHGVTEILKSLFEYGVGFVTDVGNIMTFITTP